jgi:hypothetical protein
MEWNLAGEELWWMLIRLDLTARLPTPTITLSVSNSVCVYVFVCVLGAGYRAVVLVAFDTCR